MKKLSLLFLSLFALLSLQAQWVNNPNTNTFIANTSDDAGEIYLATNSVTGDTYVQWNQFFSNGWSPTLQRLNSEGTPQWGASGIHIGAHEFSSMSEGVAMATTTDGGVVSCFSAYDGFTYALKLNPDGTFAWGEQGVKLFGGLGFSRAEVIAGDDGGVWALGFDYSNLYLQYVNADGSLNPTVTISDNGGQKCMYGQLTLSYENRVFVTYEKCGNGFYTDKQIFVAGYNTDGSQFSPETLLMSTQVFQVTYIHTAVPDGIGGGYVYLWHPGIGSVFNTYVFHFDQYGASTISSTNGIPVHSSDPYNFYLDAYATVDPESHDLLIAYQQTDADTQTQCTLLINRINEIGVVAWGDGIRILDNGTIPCGGLRIDAFEFGGGFSVIYHKGINQTGYQSTVEAKGFSMDGILSWTTEMCTNTYAKTGDQNSTGFHGGQNIVAWVNADTGGLYGQNIGQEGEMGEVLPPEPPTPCLAPTNFQGEYVYTSEMFGPMLSWEAPEIQPLHYNLYCEATKEVIEIDGQYTSYFEDKEIGNYVYRLTAVYDDCESDYALTPNGADYVLVEVTSVPETNDETIVTLLKVYNMNGQLVAKEHTDELSPGIYIFQGLTQNGKLIQQKRIIAKP